MCACAVCGVCVGGVVRACVRARACAWLPPLPSTNHYPSPSSRAQTPVMTMMGLRGTGKTSILPFLNDILKEQAEPRITFIENDFGEVVRMRGKGGDGVRSRVHVRMHAPKIHKHPHSQTQTPDRLHT